MKAASDGVLYPMANSFLRDAFHLRPYLLPDSESTNPATFMMAGSESRNYYPDLILHPVSLENLNHLIGLHLNFLQMDCSILYFRSEL